MKIQGNGILVKQGNEVKVVQIRSGNQDITVSNVSEAGNIEISFRSRSNYRIMDAKGRLQSDNRDVLRYNFMMGQ